MDLEIANRCGPRDRYRGCDQFSHRVSSSHHSAVARCPVFISDRVADHRVANHPCSGGHSKTRDNKDSTRGQRLRLFRRNMGDRAGGRRNSGLGQFYCSHFVKLVVVSVMVILTCGRTVDAARPRQTSDLSTIERKTDIQRIAVHRDRNDVFAGARNVTVDETAKRLNNWHRRNAPKKYPASASLVTGQVDNVAEENVDIVHHKKITKIIIEETDDEDYDDTLDDRSSSLSGSGDGSGDDSAESGSDGKLPTYSKRPGTRPDIVPTLVTETENQTLFLRVSLTIISVAFSPDLEDERSSNYVQLARDITMAMEEELQFRLPGKQELTVIGFQQGKRGRGVEAELGLISRGLGDVHIVESQLREIVREGRQLRTRDYDGRELILGAEGFNVRILAGDEDENEDDEPTPPPPSSTTTWTTTSTTTVASPPMVPVSHPTTTAESDQSGHATPTPPAPRRSSCSSPHEFLCTDGQCVDVRRRCDGRRDCSDDEDNCINEVTDDRVEFCTDDGEMLCDVFRCLPLAKRCDGLADCRDGSDEINCRQPSECREDEFRCLDGRCIDERQRCDGVRDCGQRGEDEFQCPSVPAIVHCREDEFRCLDGRCIDSRKRCDGVRDCGHHGDDEHQCPSVPALVYCHEDEFRCLDGRCIDGRKRCDGVHDCGHHGEDEHQCPSVNPDPRPSLSHCREFGDFRCTDGSCVDERRRCDSRPDCNDGSDERNCSQCIHGFHCRRERFCIDTRRRCDGTRDCDSNEDESDCRGGDESGEKAEKVRCTRLQWRCSDSDDDADECVDLSQRCDGVSDCDDGSDEWQCKRENPVCPENGFRCSSTGHCILQNMRCDGKSDCPHDDRSDEDDCPCRETEFQCRDGTCVARQRQCDGRYDCPDGTDESACIHGRCSSDEFLCNDGRCIASAGRCDGRVDCRDFSDEANCHTALECRGFECLDGSCIDASMRCNGRPECRDSSDETNCQAPTPAEPQECPDNGFRCWTGGPCMLEQLRCDGKSDCPQDTDEQDCPGRCNPLTQWQCGDFSCIDLRDKCNGKYDCYDGSDEGRECGSREECRREFGKFRCVRDGLCIDALHACDGIFHCQDGSDETDCGACECRCDISTGLAKCQKTHSCIEDKELRERIEFQCQRQYRESIKRDNSSSSDFGSGNLAVYPRVQVVKTEQEAVIRCRDETRARESVVWKRHGNVLQSSRNGRLTLPRVTIQDGGEYVCVARDGRVVVSQLTVVQATEERLMFLRVSLTIISVSYSSDLEDERSSNYVQLARDITLALEEELRFKLPGKMELMVVGFRQGSRGRGVEVELGLISRSMSDIRSIENLLREIVREGRQLRTRDDDGRELILGAEGFHFRIVSGNENVGDDEEEDTPTQPTLPSTSTTTSTRPHLSPPTVPQSASFQQEDVHVLPFGASLELNCSATLPPPVSFQWRRLFDNNSSPAVVAGSRRLSLSAVTLDDSASYECLAANRQTNIRVPIHLRVKRSSPLFDGNSSMIRIKRPLQQAYLNTSIRLHVRPHRHNGLILFNSQSNYTTRGDFIALHLTEDGRVAFQFSLGAEPVTLMSPSAIGARRWTVVQVTRERQIARLSVGDQTPVVASASGRHVGLDLFDSLYLGNLPADHAYKSIFPNPFAGCISSRIESGDKSIDFHRDSEPLNIGDCCPGDHSGLCAE